MAGEGRIVDWPPDNAPFKPHAMALALALDLAWTMRVTDRMLARMAQPGRFTFDGKRHIDAELARRARLEDEDGE